MLKAFIAFRHLGCAESCVTATPCGVVTVGGEDDVAENEQLSKQSDMLSPYSDGANRWAPVLLRIDGVFGSYIGPYTDRSGRGFALWLNADIVTARRRVPLSSGAPKGGVGVFDPHPPKFRRLSKIVPNSTRL